MNTARHPSFKFAVILVSVFLTLSACELILRIWTPKLLVDIKQMDYYRSLEKKMGKPFALRFRRSDDPILIYEPMPGYRLDDYCFINHQGLWNKGDIPLHKTSDTYRIIVLGDSIGAACFSNEKRFGFPHLLEDKLNQSGIFSNRQFEVLNFCVDGYSTLQEARKLHLQARYFNPDLIILQYCMNDPCISAVPAVYFLEPKESGSYLVEMTLRMLRLKESHIIGTLLAPNDGPDEGQGASLHWKFIYGKDFVPWRNVLEGMDIIQNDAHELGIPVLQVIFPLFPVKSGKWKSEFTISIHKQVEYQALQHHFLCCDLLDEYSKYSTQDIGIGDIYHPNPKGHQIAADRIFKYMIENILLSNEIKD